MQFACFSLIGRLPPLSVWNKPMGHITVIESTRDDSESYKIHKSITATRNPRSQWCPKTIPRQRCRIEKTKEAKNCVASPSSVQLSLGLADPFVAVTWRRKCFGILVCAIRLTVAFNMLLCGMFFLAYTIEISRLLLQADDNIYSYLDEVGLCERACVRPSVRAYVRNCVSA